MTDDTPHAFYSVHVPTIWERLGFRRRFDEELFAWRNEEPKPEDGLVPSALCTHVRVHIDWWDRLRLLVSGACEIEVYTKTDVLVNKAISRSQFSVLPPGKTP